MEELYWINAIGNLNTACGWLLGTSTVIFVIMLFRCFIVDEFMDRQELTQFRRLLKISAVALVVSGLLLVFVPTRTDIYRIYGIGGLIEHIRQDSTDIKIPHNVQTALDKYIESVNGKETE